VKGTQKRARSLLWDFQGGGPGTYLPEQRRRKIAKPGGQSKIKEGGKKWVVRRRGREGVRFFFKKTDPYRCLEPKSGIENLWRVMSLQGKNGGEQQGANGGKKEKKGGRRGFTSY